MGLYNTQPWFVYAGLPNQMKGLFVIVVTLALGGLQLSAQRPMMTTGPEVAKPEEARVGQGARSGISGGLRLGKRTTVG